MTLEGVITNVANFGAFVDIGVHQDGLVHVSALSNTFVKDPHTVVKTGQVVKVKVLEVDIPRKRVSLTMRLSDEVTPRTHGQNAQNSAHRSGERMQERGHTHSKTTNPKGNGQANAATTGPSGGFANNALAAAFAKAQKQ